LEEYGVGHFVPMLVVYNYASNVDDSVTLSFFNTVLGGMRAVGAVEINKTTKTVAITEGGMILWQKNGRGSVAERLEEPWKLDAKDGGAQ
jgi:hypothetical protein